MRALHFRIRVAWHLVTPIAVSLTLTSVTAPLLAQRGTANNAEVARRVPVTIAIVDSVPYGGAPAVVLRRATSIPRDVIVLGRAAASGEQLSAAIATLLVARELGGDTARADAVLRVNATRGPAAWTTGETRITSAFVSRVLAGSAENVSGVGAAFAGPLYLLPKALRGKVVNTR